MIGCGTWIMHNLYLQGRTEGNSTMLKQMLFPMLRAFVQVYNHHRFIDSDGVMHLPYTNSPEYPKQLPGNDTNYDVAYEMLLYLDSLNADQIHSLRCLQESCLD